LSAKRNLNKHLFQKTIKKIYDSDERNKEWGKRGRMAVMETRRRLVHAPLRHSLLIKHSNNTLSSAITQKTMI